MPLLRTSRLVTASHSAGERTPLPSVSSSRMLFKNAASGKWALSSGTPASSTVAAASVSCSAGRAFSGVAKSVAGTSDGCGSMEGSGVTAVSGVATHWAVCGAGAAPSSPSACITGTEAAARATANRQAAARCKGEKMPVWLGVYFRVVLFFIFRVTSFPKVPQNTDHRTGSLAGPILPVYRVCGIKSVCQTTSSGFCVML